MLRLQYHLFFERSRQAGRYAIRTRRDDASVLPEQGDLAGAAFAPEHAELENELTLTDRAESSHNLVRRVQVLPLLNFEHGPAKVECTIEPLFHLNVEPRIDSLVDELQ